MYSFALRFFDTSRRVVGSPNSGMATVLSSGLPTSGGAGGGHPDPLGSGLGRRGGHHHRARESSNGWHRGWLSCGPSSGGWGRSIPRARGSNLRWPAVPSPEGVSLRRQGGRLSLDPGRMFSGSWGPAIPGAGLWRHRDWLSRVPGVRTRVVWGLAVLQSRRLSSAGLGIGCPEPLDFGLGRRVC